MKQGSITMSPEQFRDYMKNKGAKARKPKRISTSSMLIVEGDAMPIKININPLTVNEAYRGTRKKSAAYESYKKVLLSFLPKGIILPVPPFEIRLKFGLSNSLSDWDNPVKPFQDVLQEMYGFNDRLIKRAVVEVDNVPKNSEYITFEIVSFNKQ